MKARIAEEAGACAVMALERVPADIRAQGACFHQLTNPSLIKYGRRGRQNGLPYLSHTLIIDA